MPVNCQQSGNIRGQSMDQSITGALRRSPLFCALNQPVFEHIQALAVPVRFSSGQVLFQQGDAATRFFVVIDGWIKLYRQSAVGEETVINIFGAGESFAEAAMFSGQTYPVSAEAVTDAALAAFEGRSFLANMERQPEIARALLSSMARRMHALVRDLEQMKGRPAPKRLAAWLVRLCGGREGPVEIRLPYEKSLIAARLGMTPESLSRAFSKLRRHGVTTRGAVVTIRDCKALRALES